MPYNFVAYSIHTKNFVVNFLHEVQFYTETDSFAFLSPPPFGD